MKKHVAEKSVSLYIITDAHLCNIIWQGTHQILKNDFNCDGRMISIFLSLLQVKILSQRKINILGSVTKFVLPSNGGRPGTS